MRRALATGNSGGFYTEFAIAIEVRRSGTRVPDGLLAYPTVVDGARGSASGAAKG